MSRNIQMVQQVGGVTDENMGRTTNATSGKAITARQDQGGLVTAEPLDNLSFARRIHGQKMLSLMEQFLTEEKQFRITNSRGVPQHVTINDGLPENDICRTKADFIITEQAWTATARQAQFDATVEMIKAVAPVAPQFALLIMDLLIDQSDMPNRDEIVKRIRQETGQKDPDADPNVPPSPEEQAADAAKKEQADMQKRAFMAKVGLDEAGAMQKAAAAGKAKTETDGLHQAAVSMSLEQFQKAMEVAFQMLSVPQAAPVSDALLKEAGYKASGLPQGIPQGALPPSAGPIPMGATPPTAAAPPPGAPSAPQPAPQMAQ
jgi:hypothetical protein